jgi:hypothetical protein
MKQQNNIRELELPKRTEQYFVTYRFRTENGNGSWNMTMVSVQGEGKADHAGVKKRYIAEHPGHTVIKVTLAPAFNINSL